MEAPTTQVVVQSPDTVTKTDLELAKNDLRREMKLWLGVGSAFGTALSGLLAVGVRPTDVAQHAESLARASGLL